MDSLLRHLSLSPPGAVGPGARHAGTSCDVACPRAHAASSPPQSTVHAEADGGPLHRTAEPGSVTSGERSMAWARRFNQPAAVQFIP